MENYVPKDAFEQMMSGIGGEVAELGNILHAMMEEKNHMRSSQVAGKVSKAAGERAKEVIGHERIGNALKRGVRDEEIHCGLEPGEGKGKRNVLKMGRSLTTALILGQSRHERPEWPVLQWIVNFQKWKRKAWTMEVVTGLQNASSNAKNGGLQICFNSKSLS